MMMIGSTRQATPIVVLAGNDIIKRACVVER